jgi:hypothetical protein
MSRLFSGYWRVYNILVRALGMMALLAGLGFVGWGGLVLLRIGLAPLVGMPGMVLLLAGFLAAGLGGTILGTPTYRPDLGDAAWDFDPFGKKSRRSATAQRSWWTGEMAGR